MVKHLKPDDPLYNGVSLFREMAAGGEEAFRLLFDRYKTRLLYLAVKMLKTPAVAEEAVQDVFMRVWINREKFHTIDDPEAYLFTMAYNSIYSQLKKIARESRLRSELVQLVQDIQYTTDEQVLAHESETLINQAVAELPPQRQAIFKLSRQQGLSHEEIARQLNISRHTVKNQLVEALRFIRRQLGKIPFFLLLLYVK
jgi:RNA polymerase sigma-70 factor (ECF subfamily)